MDLVGLLTLYAINFILNSPLVDFDATGFNYLAFDIIGTLSTLPSDERY
jgi:hypothetical protein